MSKAILTPAEWETTLSDWYNTMKNTSDHWNTIFTSKDARDLGWFERDLSPTLRLIEQACLAPNSKIFLPGAGTSQLVDELLAQQHRLVLNDISDKALAIQQQRLGTVNCEYLHHNIAQELTANFAIDMWIDRAVLHFLLTEQEITGYFDNLKSVVKPLGYVLLAQFSKGGSTRCANLDIHQYDLKEMQQRLGNEFNLIASKDYAFINPYQQEKPYIYGLFQRQG